MPTSSLTSGGLQRYSRWLAIQKAKGRVPSSTEVSAFLQGEIEANISTDTQREKLSLSREEIGNQKDFYDRRLDLLEDAQDSTKRADKIRGITEISKLGLAINEGTGGDLWKGVKAGAGAVWDYGSDLFDGGAETIDYASAFGESALSAAGGGVVDAVGTGSEVAAFDFTDVLPDWEAFAGLF
jgi:hypothetical protein